MRFLVVQTGSGHDDTFFSRSRAHEQGVLANTVQALALANNLRSPEVTGVCTMLFNLAVCLASTPNYLHHSTRLPSMGKKHRSRGRRAKKIVEE